MAGKPNDPTDFSKPIQMLPTEADAARMEYVHGRLGIRGAIALREGLAELANREKRRERAEKAAETRAAQKGVTA